MTKLRINQTWECKQAKFLNRDFELDNSLIMDYSEMAERGIKDMIDIDELNHATILHNLFQRYLNDDIYTYVGITLLAVNPFKQMSHKYPEDLMVKENLKIIEADSNSYIDVMRKLQPHTYAISAYALKQMKINRQRQAIVISGESGAGKTISAK